MKHSPALSRPFRTEAQRLRARAVRLQSNALAARNADNTADGEREWERLINKARALEEQALELEKGGKDE